MHPSGVQPDLPATGQKRGGGVVPVGPPACYPRGGLQRDTCSSALAAGSGLCSSGHVLLAMGLGGSVGLQSEQNVPWGGRTLKCTFNRRGPGLWDNGRLPHYFWARLVAFLGDWQVVGSKVVYGKGPPVDHFCPVQLANPLGKQQVEPKNSGTNGRCPTIQGPDC